MEADERMIVVTEQIYERLDYLTKEYDLSVAEIVGILEIIKADILEKGGKWEDDLA